MRPYETGATLVDFLVLGDWNLERTYASYSQGDWERLVELKDRYDPNNLFRFDRNIPPLRLGNKELEEVNLKPKAGAG
jgi:Berberine and berberine like